MRRLPRPLLFSLLAAVFAALAACNSSSRRESEPEGPKPVAMRGETFFFDNAIRVEMTVSRGRTVPFDGKEGHGGGGKSGRRHKGADDNEPTYLNVYSHTGDKDQDTDQPVAIIQVGGWGPAVTMRLKLENVGKDTLPIEIRDVNSDLGNFAVRPDKAALGPGQSLEPDPMISELGVTSDTIPVTIILRVRGKTEKHDLLLKNLFTPPPK